MEKINYPLLCFRLREDAVLGLLVGTEHQLVDRDVRSLKSALNDYLSRQYKKTEFYPYFDIETPRLKIIHVTVRPTYREAEGSYPLPYTLRAPVPIVYGQIDEAHFECYLPLFQQSFYYYDAQQLDSLAQHFALNVLNNYTPEQIYRLLQYPEPQLDTVSLRVNADRSFNWGRFDFRRKYRTLPRLAEQYPYAKNVRRGGSALPEAAWEMEDKVNDVLNKLLNTRSNVIIAGNSGVGKSAVLMQALRKIAHQSRKQNPPYTFWRIMPQRITASAKYLGEWEETVEALIEELNLANGILWVVDLIQLLLSGGGGPEDSVAAFLLAYLQQGKLQIIGEATPQELESMRRLLPGFVEYFQIVHLDDLPETKIQAILRQFVQYVRQNHRIAIEPEALALAYRLLLRFYPYESFPGKGIKFLAQCISQAKASRQTSISRQDVIAEFTRQTGMPERFLRDDLPLDQAALRNYFERRIIGQPAVVDKLCEIVKVFKAGLNNPYRPISTLIFAGPTGVGKTASAKALADYFFGEGQKKFPLIRIDMSEFQHPSQLGRLIGAGREAGQLVREIREKPFSVLLLDEVEKADVAIFDALLTVLDEGMLTDAYGRITNFRNAIIIMTTNLGASNQQSIGFSQTTSEERLYLSAIERHFRPEFVNRIDGIVVFRSLLNDDVREIARKELDELKSREGLLKRGLEVRFTDRVVDHLTQVGFDPRYGARPLQRALEQTLVSPIANWLLQHPDLQQRRLLVDLTEKGIRITAEGNA